MRRLFKSKYGFTLVEVLVAAGIASGVGLLAFGLLSTSTKTVNTTLVFNETSFLKNQVVAYISMPENCMLNFQGKTIGTVASPEPYTILSRKLPTGASAPFLEKDKSYGLKQGSNAVTVTNIRTYLSATKPNIMNIEVNYQILDTLKVDTTRKADSFIVEVFIGKDPQTSTKVSSCFTDTAKMIRDAVRLSCNPSGNANGTVTYNGSVMPYGECVHHNIETRDEGGSVIVNNICPSNQFLVRTDTANGTAAATTTPGKIIFTCKTLTLNTSCSAGQYLKEIDANGNAVCVSMSSILATMPNSYVVSTTTGAYVAQDLNCATGQVLQRFNSAGKHCVAKTIAKTCNANEYVDSVDTSGNVICKPVAKTATTCPNGQYVRGVSANGSITSCGALTINASCGGATPIITSIDINGNATGCAGNN